MERPTILVTAANGFGPFIIKGLHDAGFHVIAIARDAERRRDALSANPTLHPLDVHVLNFTTEDARNPDFWEQFFEEHGVDGVINNAMVSPKNEITLPRHQDQTRTWQVNAEAAGALFKACAEADVSLIQMSTARAHQLNDDRDHYRMSKNAATAQLQRLTTEEGLNGVVIEVGMVAVPEEGYYKLEQMAALPFTLKPNGNGALQPADVRDVTAGMAGVMTNLLAQDRERVIPGKIYRAAGPRTVTLPDYLNEIRGVLGIGRRLNIGIPLPIGLAQKLMWVNERLPVKIFGPFDEFDMKELRRNFRAKPQEVDDFVRAGNLEGMRDPTMIYQEWAIHNKAYGPVGAALAVLGMDFEGSARRRLPALAKQLGLVYEPEEGVAGKGHCGEPYVIPQEAIEEARQRPGRQKVLVIGATGLTGPAIVQELLAAGHEVVAVVRNPEKARKQIPYDGIEFIRMDLSQLLDGQDPFRWHDILDKNGITTIVNNAGIANGFGGQDMLNVNAFAPMAIFQVAATISRLRQEKNAATPPIRLVQVSTGGVIWDDWDQHDYTHTKAGAEAYLHTIGADRYLNWVIVRPNAVVQPKEGYIPVMMMARSPLMFTLPFGTIQPIHNQDLALGIAALVEPGHPVQHEVINASGPEQTTWEKVFRDVRKAIGGGSAISVQIPLPLAKLGARVMHILPDSLLNKLGSLSKIDPETLDIVTKSCTCEGNPWEDATGVRPVSVVDAFRACVQGGDVYANLLDGQRERSHRRNAQITEAETERPYHGQAPNWVGTVMMPHPGEPPGSYVSTQISR